MILLTNHLGYDSKGTKRAVYQGSEEDNAGLFEVVDCSKKIVFSGKANFCGEVAGWKTGCYWTLDFEGLEEPGSYYIRLNTATGTVESAVFEIQDNLITMRMINAAGYYFKAQRSSGEWLAADRKLHFLGEKEGSVDAHGGWYDATGDYGIHISHLSHGSIHNPQQAAFSAYAFFKSVEWLEESDNTQYSMIKRRMLDEGSFGADFIMRMRAPSGSFYRSINRANALQHVRGTRGIGFEYRGSSAQFSEKAATADEEIIRDENYEVSLRSGGGLCIAALAAASRHYYPGRDYTSEEYLLAAKDAWHYLSAENSRYTNDGNWNLLDEYCALLALTELYRASGEYEYLEHAGEMAIKIQNRMESLGTEMAWFTAKEEEPFYHASDEGMPIIALLEYAKIEPDQKAGEAAIKAAEECMRYKLTLTNGVNNPFGYARFVHRAQDGSRKEKFFFPHDTAVAPWWQGDNARIASLSSAARQMSYVTKDTELAAELTEFADNQLNWIMGMNPFDSCMIEGYGRNNIQYFFNKRYDFMNCPGGICNGITGGLHDEDGIAFIMEPNEEIQDNWRWAEQWLPHISWFICAQALKRR